MVDHKIGLGHRSETGHGLHAVQHLFGFFLGGFSRRDPGIVVPDDPCHAVFQRLVTEVVPLNC